MIHFITLFITSIDFQLYYAFTHMQRLCSFHGSPDLRTPSFSVSNVPGIRLPGYMGAHIYDEHSRTRIELFDTTGTSFYDEAAPFMAVINSTKLIVDVKQSYTDTRRQYFLYDFIVDGKFVACRYNRKHPYDGPTTCVNCNKHLANSVSGGCITISMYESGVSRGLGIDGISRGHFFRIYRLGTIKFRYCSVSRAEAIFGTAKLVERGILPKPTLNSIPNTISPVTESTSLVESTTSTTTMTADASTNVSADVTTIQVFNHAYKILSFTAYHLQPIIYFTVIVANVNVGAAAVGAAEAVGAAGSLDQPPGPFAF